MLSDDGSIEPSWAHTKRSVWKAWWGNFGRGRYRAPIEKQIALLNRVALPIILFQCLLWPWSQTTAKRVDALQSHLIARMLRLPPLEGEDSKAYNRRRARAGSRLTSEHGAWSGSWSRRLASWIEHLHRHPACWITRLLRTRDHTWLGVRRAVFAGKTRTRVIRQYVQRRYADGLIDWEKFLPSTGLVIPRLGSE